MVPFFPKKAIHKFVSGHDWIINVEMDAFNGYVKKFFILSTEGRNPQYIKASFISFVYDYNNNGNPAV